MEVNDLAATLKKAQQLGGKVVMEPTDIPGMVSFAMLTDIDGNLIGITTPQPPPAR